MTFDEYIKNPSGTFVMTNKQMYAQLYTQKWDTLKVRENGLIIYKLYHSHNDYYIHMKIPSEVVPKFYYDTVVRFYQTTKGVIENDLSKYQVQFYSNDPSFVYTFAHAFQKNDLLIPDLKNKMSKLALSSVAKERNPNDEVGYVKSIYFMYLEIKHLKLFKKSNWEGIKSPYTKAVWNNTVMHADDKVALRQEESSKMSKSAKREANKEKNNEKSSTGVKKHGFVNTTSPNIPGFGHFKKTPMNTIKSSITKTISSKIKKNK